MQQQQQQRHAGPRLKRADISLSTKIDFPVWLYVALPPCRAASRATSEVTNERWKKTGDRLPRLARRNEMVKARERKGRERAVLPRPPINNKQIGHYPKSMAGEQPGHGNRERAVISEIREARGTFERTAEERVITRRRA